MSQVNNWYVITGGPSTGKTTLLSELEKLGHKVVPEAARVYIDQGLAKGLTIKQIRANEEMFQCEVLRMKQKVETELKADEVVFLDRGMQDSLAYLQHYGYKFEQWMKQLMEQSQYKKVFLLEPLATFVADYARTEDKAFSESLNQLLHKAYSKFGMKPILVPPTSPAERAAFVLRQVKLEQPA